MVVAARQRHPFSDSRGGPIVKPREKRHVLRRRRDDVRLLPQLLRECVRELPPGHVRSKRFESREATPPRAPPVPPTKRAARRTSGWRPLSCLERYASSRCWTSKSRKRAFTARWPPLGKPQEKGERVVHWCHKYRKAREFEKLRPWRNRALPQDSESLIQRAYLEHHRRMTRLEPGFLVLSVLVYCFFRKRHRKAMVVDLVKLSPASRRRAYLFCWRGRRPSRTRRWARRSRLYSSWR